MVKDFKGPHGVTSDGLFVVGGLATGIFTT